VTTEEPLRKTAAEGDSGPSDAPGGDRRRTGRRRGRPETRQEILEAARTLFAERGYVGTSIRAVATAASVDPALVPHYFGNKEGLFRAALEIPIDPEDIVRTIVSAGPEQAPMRLVETLLRVWDSPVTGPAMVSVLRRAVAEQGSTEMLRDFFGATVLRVITGALLEDLPPEEARARAALVVSQMFGLVLMRRVLALEPIASMPADRLAAAVAPTIARYLHGDLTDLRAAMDTPPDLDPHPDPNPDAAQDPPAAAPYEENQP
jgi:AcrR family transcriptional regulator